MGFRSDGHRVVLIALIHRLCVLATMGAFILAPVWARAQTPTTAPDLGSTLASATLANLPSSGQVFSVLETTQPEVIADRFFSGGLNTGVPARLGAFLGSWTQTQFRIGDVNVTDPTGRGSALLWPELLFWQHVTTTTGLMPVDVNASALIVTLEPRRPGSHWTRVLDGMVTGSPLLSTPTSGVAPAIDRLTSERAGSILVSGPLVPDRLGLVAAGSWIKTSQIERAGPIAIDDSVGSVFAHLVVTATPRDEVRALAWIQRTSIVASTDVSVHLQSTWERRRPSEDTAWRVVGSYTRRERAPQGAPTALAVDSVTSDPIPDLIDSGGDTTRRWTLAARLGTRAARQTLAFGIDLDAADVRVTPTPITQIAEQVDGIPARIWVYTDPGIDAHRHERTIAAYGNDRVELASRLALNAGLRVDTIRGAADGSASAVRWHTWQPRVNLRWDITPIGAVAFIAGYGRVAHQVTLDLLAIGDPAAPVANVYRWNGSVIGPLVERVGPGTGGDAAFNQIDPQLRRPYTDEAVLAIESRPTKTARFRLAGIAKREHSLIGLADVGAPSSAYTVIGVSDPGLDPGNPANRQILPVYNRLPSSFGQDRYVLTNQPGKSSNFAGVEATAEASMDRLFILAGATASRAVGPAGSIGFLATENDQGALGNLLTNPNASTYARGRLFSDRAYTVKLSATWRFPRDVRLGAIARYQDGQPFARLVIASDLNQGSEAVRAFANGGSRFTYTGTLDVRVQKGFLLAGSTLTAIVDAYNVISLSNEVEENVVSGPTFRMPTAVQPPRAVIVGVRFAR